MKCVNVLDILVQNNFDPKSIENIKDNICLNIITKNLDLCIDANIAKAIINYQNMIYTIYCFGKYGCADLRKLTLDERNRLGLKFKIEKGSTDYLANVKEILKMFIGALPEQHRLWGLITICITLSGSLGGYLYYKHKENNLNQATNRLAIERLADIAEENAIARKAIEYTMAQDREAAKNFEASGSEIIINGETYSPERIAEIIKEYAKRPERKQVLPSSRNVTERYIVTNIETKAPYRLTLENNGKIIRPTYNPDFLDDAMLSEVQASVNKSIPVQFDFDINITTDQNGKESLSIIKINKVKK